MSIEEEAAKLEAAVAQVLARGQQSAPASPYDAARQEFVGIPLRQQTPERATMRATNQVLSVFQGLPAMSPAGREALETTEDVLSLVGEAPEAQKLGAEFPKGEFKDYVTSPSGRIMFSNGVIADPSTGELLFPPVGVGRVDPSEVPGSPEWLLKVQKQWTDEKANTWRQRLSEQGYEVAKKGGIAYDLLDALRSYHTNRYLNFGKPIPLTPRETRKSLRRQIDFQSLKEEVKSWGEVLWSESLDDVSADFFADRTLDVAVRLMKEKGWSSDQAIAGAGLRVQKEFIKTPGVKGALRDAEELEGDTTLRDQMASLSQVVSI